MFSNLKLYIVRKELSNNRCPPVHIFLHKQSNIKHADLKLYDLVGTHICTIALGELYLLFNLTRHQLHLPSFHYAVTHVRNKNSNIQGRSPYVVKVIFHTIRNCS